MTGSKGSTPMRERIKQLEDEAEEAKSRYLRLAADFDNFKKRTRQEQAEQAQYASSDLIAKLLPVLDNLHRVLESATDVDDTWLKGLKLTIQSLDETLDAQGLRPIDALGEPFDPNLHEAIGHEESDDHPDDTVMQQIRRGYRLHDRVLRPALVKVSKKRAGAQATQPSE